MQGNNWDTESQDDAGDTPIPSGEQKTGSAQVSEAVSSLHGLQEQMCLSILLLFHAS